MKKVYCITLVRPYDLNVIITICSSEEVALKHLANSKGKFEEFGDVIITERFIWDE